MTQNVSGRIAERAPRASRAAPRLGKEFSEGGFPGQRLLSRLSRILRHEQEYSVGISTSPTQGIHLLV